jgi:hypothetical protein
MFPESKGVYVTASAPNCEEPYHGIYKTASVYVLDINGPNEQFFPRGERNTAVRKARTERLTLDRVAATSLCHSTMLELLGA